jgi:hypothetical protein
LQYKNDGQIADETFIHIFCECPTVRDWHDKFFERYFPVNYVLDDQDRRNILFLGNVHEAEKDNFFIMASILIFQYCIWDLRLKKKILSFHSLDNIFKETISVFIRTNTFLSSIIADLTKLKYSLRKKLQPATVLDGIELICGQGCGRDRVEQTLLAGWSADPVHPNAHIYAKMALNILEKVSPAPGKAKQPQGQRKRKRSDSESLSGSVSVTGGKHGGQQGMPQGPGRSGYNTGGHGSDAHSHSSLNYSPVTNRGRGYGNYSGAGNRQYAGYKAGGYNDGGYSTEGYPAALRGQARGPRW